MALLKIINRAAEIITWGSTSLQFIRGESSTKDASVSFSNAVNKTFTAGQVLHTEGTSGSSGFFEVKSKNAVTLNGSGSFAITVAHYPSATQSNQTKNVTVSGNTIAISLSYNSKPIIEDVEVETANRTPYVFQMSDFIYSDYDSDPMTEILIEGTLTGFELDGMPYLGSWIPAADIIAGKLIYIPLDQDAYYEKDNTWKAKDSNGNISVT